MKRNTKGFTLIELLAVIVILAVIALIATPIIMNVINDAKKGANKDAALGYVKSVETSIAVQMIKCPSMTVGAITKDSVAISGCSIDGEPVSSVEPNYKGTAPDAVNLTYGTDGKITGKVQYGSTWYDAETGDETTAPAA